jgi:hypothetical protein
MGHLEERREEKGRENEHRATQIQGSEIVT